MWPAHIRPSYVCLVRESRVGTGAGAGDRDGMSRLIAIALAAAVSLAAVPAAGAMDLGRLAAPPSVCTHQGDLSDPVDVQVGAMLCMTNFARRHVGALPLAGAASLNRSALDKSHDILRCDSFSHEACGREFTYWMQRVGYLDSPCWRAGENIAWGSGDLGTVRSIFVAWIHSPGHRENILGDFRQIGIGLRTGTLAGYKGAHVWTQDFGSHC
jgi:uncharacterized protein YkwD